MFPCYEDITERLGKPVWYYEDGYPRYRKFHPELCGVYDEQVALCVIRCQACHTEFLVSSCMDKMKLFSQAPPHFREMEFPTKDSPGSFNTWGDPPRHSHWEGTCAAGDTMMSEMVRIAEFWIRDHYVKSPTFMEWIRYPEYEFDYSHQL